MGGWISAGVYGGISRWPWTMWGILSHIKYGRHRGTMAKTIVSRETRRQSSISYDSSSLTSSLFFSPPPLQFWKNFLISDSDLATTRQHFRCFLLFFSCFSAQWIKWCYRRYRRRYQSRARASFNKKKKKGFIVIIINKWITTRRNQPIDNIFNSFTWANWCYWLR